MSLRLLCSGTLRYLCGSHAHSLSHALSCFRSPSALLWTEAGPACAVGAVNCRVNACGQGRFADTPVSTTSLQSGSTVMVLLTLISRVLLAFVTTPCLFTVKVSIILTGQKFKRRKLHDGLDLTRYGRNRHGNF